MLKSIRLPLATAYLLSFGLAALYWKWEGRVDPGAPLPFFLFTSVYMWIPGIVALIFAKREGISLPFFHRFNRFYWLAPLSALILSGAALAMSLFVGTWNPKLDQYQMGLVIYTAVGILLALTLYAFLSFGEELLWRGYLHSKLKSFGPLKASLAIGLMWGIWYAPLVLLKYNYPTHPAWGVAMGILITMSSSPFLFYLRERGGAIVVPALFRGVITVFSSITFVFFISPNYLLLGTTGLIGVILFTLFSVYALKTLK